MIGKKLGNRYTIVEKLGGGGMAEVYKAKCSVLKRFVAIKILRQQFVDDDEVLKSFKKEAESAAILSSPNIVSIYDVGVEGSIHYIVMEYIDGVTLKEYIMKRRYLDEIEVSRISLDIAEALRVAHSNNIVHRDIKPQNIMITNDNIVKVMDFGIARAATSSTINNGQDILGSAHYISPEQARGGYVDQKSDIYSLGVVMYEMVSGKPPFMGESPIAVAIKQLQEEAVPLSEIRNISPDLERIISKCMKKDQSQRYDNVEDLKRDVIALGNIGNIMNSQEDEFATQKIPIINDREEEEDMKVKKIKKKKMSKKLVALAVILALIASYFLSTAIFNNFLARSEVPKVVGLSEEEAEKKLKEKKFKMEVLDEEYNDDIEKGKIARQDPEGGKEARNGSKIGVYISKGKGGVKVPNLRGMDLEDAKDKIEDEGFKVGKISYETSSRTEDTVLRQTPRASIKVEKGTKINLVVSKKKAEEEKKPETENVTVPNVIGMSRENARAAFINAGLEIGIVSEQFSENPSGTVISQGAQAGSSIAKGTGINVVLSKGTEKKDNTKTTSVTINLPQDKDTVQVVIRKIQNGVTTNVYNETVETSRGSVTYQVTATGTGTVRVEGLVDGTIVATENMTL